MYPGFRAEESATMNRTLQRAAKKGVSMKADVQSLATADVDVNAIESVSLTFKNSRLLALSDVDIQDLAYKRRDARCIRAVELRKAAGFTVTMISEALQADVDYTVNWSRTAKLSAEAKVAQLQALSAGLGLNAESATDKTMSGQGLFFGVKDDLFLAYLWLPEQLPQVQRNSMVFDSQSVTDVASECEDANDEGYCAR